MFYGSLSGLPLLKKGKSRSINWENRTGEKGKGGMAASDLGPSRKGSPCIPGLEPGETVTLVSYTHLDVYKRQGYPSMLFLK